MSSLCFNNQTQAECLAAVKRDGLQLRNVLYQTEEIIKAAVMQDGEALVYISPRNKDTQTEEIELLALKSTPEVTETLMEYMTMTVNTACAVLDNFDKVGEDRGHFFFAIWQKQLSQITEMSKKDRDLIQETNPEMAIIHGITRFLGEGSVGFDDKATKESLTRNPSLFWFIGKALFGYWRDRGVVAGKYARFVLDLDVTNKSTIGIDSIMNIVESKWGYCQDTVRLCKEWKVDDLVFYAYSSNPLAAAVINSYGFAVVDGELTYENKGETL